MFQKKRKKKEDFQKFSCFTMKFCPRVSKILPTNCGIVGNSTNLDHTVEYFWIRQVEIGAGILSPFMDTACLCSGRFIIVLSIKEMFFFYLTTCAM